MLQKETSSLIPIRRIAATLLCLALFLSAQFRGQFQHFLAHSAAHEALHDAAVEADACHQAIFHQGSNTACEHPAHITETTTECELCDCLLQLTDFSLFKVVITAPLFNGQAIFSFLSPNDSSPLLLATARAPPCTLL